MYSINFWMSDLENTPWDTFLGFSLINFHEQVLRFSPLVSIVGYQRSINPDSRNA